MISSAETGSHGRGVNSIPIIQAKNEGASLSQERVINSANGKNFKISSSAGNGGEVESRAKRASGGASSSGNQKDRTPTSVNQLSKNISSTSLNQNQEDMDRTVPILPKTLDANGLTLARKILGDSNGSHSGQRQGIAVQNKNSTLPLSNIQKKIKDMLNTKQQNYIAPPRQHTQLEESNNSNQLSSQQRSGPSPNTSLIVSSIGKVTSPYKKELLQPMNKNVAVSHVPSKLSRSNIGTSNNPLKKIDLSNKEIQPVVNESIGSNQGSSTDNRFIIDKPLKSKILKQFENSKLKDTSAENREAYKSNTLYQKFSQKLQETKTAAREDNLNKDISLNAPRRNVARLSSPPTAQPDPKAMTQTNFKIAKQPSGHETDSNNSSHSNKILFKQQAVKLCEYLNSQKSSALNKTNNSGNQGQKSIKESNNSSIVSSKHSFKIHKRSESETTGMNSNSRALTEPASGSYSQGIDELGPSQRVSENSSGKRGTFVPTNNYLNTLVGRSKNSREKQAIDNHNSLNSKVLRKKSQNENAEDSPRGDPSEKLNSLVQDNKSNVVNQDESNPIIRKPAELKASPLPVISMPKLDSTGSSLNASRHPSRLYQILRQHTKNIPFVGCANVYTKDFGRIQAFSVNTHQGKVREYNEDRVSILLNSQQRYPNIAQLGISNCNFFAVYDGHGGEACCNFLKEKLHGEIISKLDLLDIEGSIKRSCASLEEDFLQRCKRNNELADSSGSCACGVLVLGRNQCYS